MSRSFKIIFCALVATSLITRPALAQESAAPPDVNSSVARGLQNLARLQKDDGTFDGAGPRLAMTALALMAFLASGHAPDLGKYGLAVRRCIDALLNEAPADGYFGRIDGSRMYGQGIITLALAEAYGIETDAAHREKIRTVLVTAVDVILKAQDISKPPLHAGGWRYEPRSGDSDLSLSGWNALALRAAQNVGINVPKESVERAFQYVLKCYREDKHGFCYQPGNDASIAMTGVGILNLYLLDAAQQPEIAAAANYLLENPVGEAALYPYYSHYYATQAAFQCGEPVWPVVWNRTRDHLMSMQSEDGGWPPSRNNEEPGRIYATSIAVLTLSVPNRLLPIYQR